MDKNKPVKAGNIPEIVSAQYQPDMAIAQFQGISSAPFPEEAQKILSAPIPDDLIEIRPDGLIYLPQTEYRRILNTAFGAGAWALRPVQPPKVQGNVMMYFGELWINGRFVSYAVGEHTYYENNPNMSYATALEAAKSDCLTRCCKDIGIALDLWNPRFVREWKKKYAVAVWCQHARTQEKKLLWRRKDDPPFSYPWKELGTPSSQPRTQEKETQSSEQELRQSYIRRINELKSSLLRLGYGQVISQIRSSVGLSKDGEMTASFQELEAFGKRLSLAEKLYRQIKKADEIVSAEMWLQVFKRSNMTTELDINWGEDLESLEEKLKKLSNDIDDAVYLTMRERDSE